MVRRHELPPLPQAKYHSKPNLPRQIPITDYNNKERTTGKHRKRLPSDGQFNRQFNAILWFSFDIYRSVQVTFEKLMVPNRSQGPYGQLLSPIIHILSNLCQV